MNRRPVLLLALLAFCLGACSPAQPFIADDPDAPPAVPADDSLRFRVFLVGNTGTPGPAEPAALRLLAYHLAQADTQSAAVFLGDYAPHPLPDSASTDLERQAAPLLALLPHLQGYPGQLIFLPGHTDWSTRARTPDALTRQARLIEQTLGRADVYLLDDGFPGPVQVDLADNITLLALNTQWWMHPHKPFGEGDDYTLNEAGDFLRELREEISRNADEQLLIVGHHPIYSNGPHAGQFPLRRFLAPVPLLSALPPLYRRFIGRSQDFAHQPYNRFRRELARLFAGQALIYASAHEQSLQHFRRGSTRLPEHHLISGSLAGTDYVAAGGQAAFTAAKPGFLTLSYYQQGSVWLSAWTPAGPDGQGQRIYHTRLRAGHLTLPDDPPDAPPTARTPPPPQTTAPNARYDRAGFLRRFWLGSHHRRLWGTPVTLPVLHLDTELGGLTPVKPGGTGQSVTLRLEDAQGRTYTLRSVDKVAGRIWPSALRNTFLRPLTQDQITALHPYGALMVPSLAQAVGVYHARPRLFIVPDDPRLGPVRETMAGRMAILEARPAGDLRGLPEMGDASDATSTLKMLRALNDDNDHRVDAHAYARARLLDLFISDWDRHGDQWRWAVFDDPDGKGKLYRPIPRDRDVAFMRFNGVLPTLIRKFAKPHYLDFKDDYGSLQALSRNALPLDRRVLARLSRADWRALADSMQHGLTDAVLQHAIDQMPAPAVEQVGAATLGHLKARRDGLPEVAEAYYALLAETVDVVGSHKHEQFEVVRLDDETTEVVMYKINKKGEVQQTLFRRRFHHAETKEVRLFGQAGEDAFLVTGTGRGGPRVIAVGGPGHDTYVDAAPKPSLRRTTRFYDTRADNTWTLQPTSSRRLSSDPGVHAYDPHGFAFDTKKPAFAFGYNHDDGLFLGGGLTRTTHAFRKTPYATEQQLRVGIATRTGGLSGRYSGHLTRIAGMPWDLYLDASAEGQGATYNFFGLGNGTIDAPPEAQGEAYYEVKIARLTTAARFEHALPQGLRLSLGPRVARTEVDAASGRFARRPSSGLPSDAFAPQYQGSFLSSLSLDTVGPGEALDGFRWKIGAGLHLPLNGAASQFATLNSELTFYTTPLLAPQLTLAMRLGGGHTLGTAPFFEMQTLGGKQTLRGYRRTRFAGPSAVYQNLEARLSVRRFSGYYGYGTLGLLAFLDQGRVWTEGPEPSGWHRGAGGGLWVRFFNTLLLSSSYAHSPERSTLQFGFGYFF